MELVRTTLRIKKNLKVAAERIAVQDETTLQDVMNRALSDFVDKNARSRAKRIRFITHDLGVPLDNLTRDDYYDDPKFE